MAGKTCVLDVDISGSVGNESMYWDKIDELLKKISADKSYSNYTYIAWDTSFENIPLEKLQSYIDKRIGCGGTNPAVV